MASTPLNLLAEQVLVVAMDEVAFEFLDNISPGHVVLCPTAITSVSPVGAKGHRVPTCRRDHVLGRYQPCNVEWVKRQVVIVVKLSVRFGLGIFHRIHVPR